MLIVADLASIMLAWLLAWITVCVWRWVAAGAATIIVLLALIPPMAGAQNFTIAPVKPIPHARPIPPDYGASPPKPKYLISAASRVRSRLHRQDHIRDRENARGAA
jgi:hypothetical protein